MFDEGPTKLHDRLSRILGLGELDHAERRSARPGSSGRRG